MGNKQKSSSFTEKDIQILATTSGKSESEIRQWYNDYLQESEHTGRMTRRQFQVYYSKLKHNPNLELITDHIFRAFDSDHSGTIEFQEFMLGYIVTSGAAKREKFEYAFEVYDINDDEKIEKKEAKKILNLICRVVGLSEANAKMYAETLMISFDQNHDKVLSRTEFIEGCLFDPTLEHITNPFNL